MVETAIATIAFVALVGSWAILPAGRADTKKEEATLVDSELVAEPV